LSMEKTAENKKLSLVQKKTDTSTSSPISPMQLIDTKRSFKWDETTLKNIIRDMGLKVTQQRVIILQSLLSGRDHITAQELFETVMQKDPSLGFATVYRFLKQLTDQDLVTEVRMGGLPARYEWAKKKNH